MGFLDVVSKLKLIVNFKSANNMSVQQIEALIDFLEGQPELALGRCSRSKEGRSLSKRLWQECADILNSVSADCVQKTGEQWRLFYNEYKHRLLKKIKKEKSERSATGGGTRIEINLTCLQERLYTILGRDVGEPIPGVRHNPFILIENEGGSGTTSCHDGVNVVTYEVTEDNSGYVQMEVVEPSRTIQRQQSEPAGSWSVFDPTVESSLASRESLQSTEGQQTASRPILRQPSESVRSQASLEPAVQSFLASRESLQSTEGQQTEPAGSQAAQQSQQTAPRRRRRRRQQIAETEYLNPSLRSATERLESIEIISAQATNRLAAAIEALGARLNEPIRIMLEDPHPSQMVHQRRKRIRIIDSDSE